MRKGSGVSLAGIAMLWAARMAVAGPPAARPHGRPSVLLIVVDTLRYDAGRTEQPGRELGVPRSLQKRGRHFLNAIAAGNYTLPSMTALMTGYYPSESGVMGGNVESKLAGPPLARRLRDAGFATAAVVSNPYAATEASHLKDGFESFDAEMT